MGYLITFVERLFEKTFNEIYFSCQPLFYDIKHAKMNHRNINRLPIVFNWKFKYAKLYS